MTLLRILLVPAALSLFTVACSSTNDGAEPQPSGVRIEDGAPVCAKGETRCAGDGGLEACTLSDGRLVWSKTACQDDAVCVEGACREPTAAQRAQADMLGGYVASLEARTGYARPLDYDALAKTGRKNILRGDGSDRVFMRELRRVQLAVPQGHQDLLFAGCGKPGSVPYATSTRYGVCGRPSGDGVVVTSAASGNTLGLTAGDRVIGVQDGAESWKAPGFLERVALEPVCGSSSPTESSRLESAAASLFGVVREGMHLTVVSPQGKTRDVTVGPEDASATFCTSPFGGVESFTAKATMRPDGVAVLRVPGFVSMDHPLPPNLDKASYQAWVQEHIALIAAELDKVKSAKGLVWDVRANFGGSPEVALEIVRGMPGASAGKVADCRHRTPGSKPPSFDPAIAASYAVGAPGGPFAYAGKVAVLTDGMTYSAGDYFVAAVRSRTQAKIVGRAPAGAFGYGGNPLEVVQGPPKFGFKIDDLGCEGPQGEPLEARTIAPDEIVEYAPADLAAGKDTVLERAAALVKP